MKRLFLPLCAALLIHGAVPTHSHALDPKNKEAYAQWQKFKKRWDQTKSFSCDLFSWGYMTDNFIKKFPELLSVIPPEKKDTAPKPKEDWRYRIYRLEFLKPDNIMITYKESKKENTEEGSIIDKAVALVLKHVPGTKLNYGYYKSWEYDDRGKKRRVHGLDEKHARTMLHKNLKDVKLKPLGVHDVFVKFPYITNDKFSEIPVPFLYKAAMKVMMIASRKEIYRQPYVEMRDSRGYSPKEVAINRVMARFEHFFDDGIVTIEDSAQFTEKDYTMASSGWLTLTNANKAKTIKKLVVKPKSVAKSKGITMVEAFYNPKTNDFYGLHEWENNKLVGVMQFMDLKVNDPKVTKSVWSDYFKNRRISEQG